MLLFFFFVIVVYLLVLLNIIGKPLNQSKIWKYALVPQLSIHFSISLLLSQVAKPVTPSIDVKSMPQKHSLRTDESQCLHFNSKISQNLPLEHQHITTYL